MRKQKATINFWCFDFYKNIVLKRHTHRKRLSAMYWPESMKYQWNWLTCSNDGQNNHWRCEVGGYQIKLISTLRQHTWGNYQWEWIITLTDRWCQHWVPPKVYHKETMSTSFVPPTLTMSKWKIIYLAWRLLNSI